MQIVKHKKLYENIVFKIYLCSNCRLNMDHDDSFPTLNTANTKMKPSFFLFFPQSPYLLSPEAYKKFPFSSTYQTCLTVDAYLHRVLLLHSTFSLQSYY